MALSGREKFLLEISEVLNAIDISQAEKLEELLTDSGEVFCYGIGRSGLAVRSFAMRLMHMGKSCSIVGDTLAHAIKSGDVLLVASASGKSENLCNIIQKAKNLGANIALITANSESGAAKLADVIVKISAPSKDESDKRTVVPMGSLFEDCAVLFFDLVVVDMMKKFNMNSKDLLKRHANLE